MDSRRDFIKKAALLAGAGALPASVIKAMSINPAPGTTFLDAEHIVILMQENRSFDHTYGTLQGVRGYNDPRAIVTPGKNLVWLQENAAGETYAPFRLNIKDTNATWLGSLPHSWTNQADARNGGRHDKWLIAKPSGHKGFASVPLTMGYYNRQDIPFYYSLADAFTVCDQNFCSSLTGTTPNRLYLWTGTVRPQPSPDSFAHVRNEDVDFFLPANWPTFPEKLEANNISWKIYQNEISLPSGLDGDQDAWLSNFTDNPIEFFSQYNVQFAASYRKYAQELVATLPPLIEQLAKDIKSATSGTSEYKKMEQELHDKKIWLQRAREAVDKYSAENFDKLPQHEKNLHEKAFCINKNDPDYRQLHTLQYTDGNEQREMKVPKGDVLHQFRHDVDNGQLPTVSWIVSPENFSDHPGAPWYGAWYVSEVMDILTKKPEVWQKTIFILCYDENDGYFDHTPPFVAPDPSNKNSGRVSEGIDAGVEYVTLTQDMKKYDEKHARESPIGLGYRVPLVIASPWSRGGNVCSQVFDHTSIIQFIEKFLKGKYNTPIKENNISAWRRTVCGDLTSVFKPYNGEKTAPLPFPAMNDFLEGIHKAKFKKDPSGYRSLQANEITAINKRMPGNSTMPVQEKGIRPAMPLPYQLLAEARLSAGKNAVELQLTASTVVFGKQSAGSPFNVYAYTGKGVQVRSYAVSAGDSLNDIFAIDDFNNRQYQICVYGPNGFFREVKGSDHDPVLGISVDYERDKKDDQKLTGNIVITVINGASGQAPVVEMTDNAYKTGKHSLALGAMASSREQSKLVLDLSKSFGWYDFTVRVKGNAGFEKRYAGHVETGKSSFTDPFMGGVV